VVVDPVMVAESGASLLDSDARDALLSEILPRASVLTPNLPEARALAGRAPAMSAAAQSAAAQSAAMQSTVEQSAVEEDAEAQALAKALLALGPGVVVLTGGHRRRIVDLFVDGTDERAVVEIDGAHHPDGAAHGSGCTHSSVLAAQLALGHTPLEAARTARALAGEAVAGALRDVGAGAGPVDVLALSRMRES
jgi:hydroxymethylpyrimidine/phosphomethylpyrimidine kinase